MRRTDRDRHLGAILSGAHRQAQEQPTNWIRHYRTPVPERQRGGEPCFGCAAEVLCGVPASAWWDAGVGDGLDMADVGAAASAEDLEVAVSTDQVCVLTGQLTASPSSSSSASSSSAWLELDALAQSNPMHPIAAGSASNAVVK
jgi:hypothetical protein